MTIGILGFGQLGKMLSESKNTSNTNYIFYAESGEPCIDPKYRIYENFSEFANDADVYTYEFENVPLNIAKKLEEKNKLFPSCMALEVTSNRVNEKNLFASLGIGTAKWISIDTESDIEKALNELGFPFRIKTSTQGYDGKGQYLIENKEDMQNFKKVFSDSKIQYIAEQVINFKREVSIISVRDKNGNIVYYPLVENKHRDGMLFSSISPTTISEKDFEKLKGWSKLIMEKLSYVGVMTLELFDTPEGFLANEIAPRVHNSGHWTIEGTNCSQFENHIRAITGEPLVEPKINGFNLMFNVVGNLPEKNIFADIENGYLHNYGKTPRIARKLGHYTIVEKSEENRQKSFEKLKNHNFFVTK